MADKLDLPHPAKLVPAKQNGIKLETPNNFSYNVSRNDKISKKIYFRCSTSKKTKCPAVATVCTKTKMIIKTLHLHNHDSNIIKSTVQALERDAISAAATTMEPPRNVLGQLTNSVVEKTSKAGVGAMKKTPTLRKALKRKRREKLCLPKEPTNMQEVKVPESLKLTIDGKPFLRVEEEIEDSYGLKKKILVFCSSDQVDQIKNSDTWLGDGTFRIVKTSVCEQLFILTGKTKTGITLPLLYAYLPNREWRSYTRIFRFLKENGVPSPKTAFHCDFEKGIVKGIRSVYPDVQVFGCDAHFKRAIRDKIVNQLKIGSLYNKSMQFQKLTRYIWALSLVPMKSIVDVYTNFLLPEVANMLKDEEYEEELGEYVDDIDELVDYVGRVYVGQVNQRTGIRKKPQYPHSMWNKNYPITEGSELTTNSSEGFNKAITSSVPNNAGLWTVIVQTRTEEATNMRKLKDSLLGPQNNTATANSTRNKRRDNRREDLVRLVSNFEKVDLPTFMASVIDFYGTDIDSKL